MASNNLLDVIRQGRSQLQGERATMQDNTQRVQGLLRAKSGRAIGTPSDTSMSSLGEAAAVDQTQATLDRLAPQIAVQQEQGDIQARRQQLETEQQRGQLEQARKFQTIDNRLKTNQILNDLARDRGSLDLEKDRARLEQASFLLSMQDQKYVNDLQQIGRAQRLDNELNFKEEMARMALGDNLDLLKSKLGTQDILAASDRDFRRLMSDLSIEDALKVADIQSKHAKEASRMGLDATSYIASQQAAQAAGEQRAQGLSGLLRGGLQAYGAYADSK